MNSLISSGRIDEGFECMEEIKQTIQTVQHENSKYLVAFKCLMINYLLGDSISILEAQTLKKQTDSMFSFFSDVIFGIAVAMNSNSKVDQMQGIKLVETGIQHTWNHMFCRVAIAVPLLDLYLKSGQIDKGLELAEIALKTIEETGIQGLLGVAEVLRLKAELLFQKNCSHHLEAEQLIQQSLQISQKKGLCLAQLKSLLSGIRLWKISGNEEALKGGVLMLKELCNFYDVTAKKYCGGNINEARKLLCVTPGHLDRSSSHKFM